MTDDHLWFRWICWIPFSLGWTPKKHKHKHGANIILLGVHAAPYRNFGAGYRPPLHQPYTVDATLPVSEDVLYKDILISKIAAMGGSQRTPSISSFQNSVPILGVLLSFKMTDALMGAQIREARPRNGGPLLVHKKECWRDWWLFRDINDEANNAFHSLRPSLARLILTTAINHDGDLKKKDNSQSDFVGWHDVELTHPPLETLMTTHKHGARCDDSAK